MRIDASGVATSRFMSMIGQCSAGSFPTPAQLPIPVSLVACGRRRIRSRVKRPVLKVAALDMGPARENLVGRGFGELLSRSELRF